ncbi:hypothetical protein [Sinorhizobium fredii]|uniref:hypothetical protein n=1 Tax=Rhizobium fredii TaxID=380 RepID=UPI0012971843|nr:hypothetical protein [Sinorhizobium fredii]MQW99589.1 hypothetical protein [Sinorhizobium fredii]
MSATSSRLALNTRKLLKTAAFSAVAVAFAASPYALAVDFSACEAPAKIQTDNLDPVSLWNGDRRVFVFDKIGQNGGRMVRVVGDIVELTPQLFPSLFREDGQYLEDVDSITIDAREIIVAMPIRMTSGHIRLQGQRITFKFHGLISFVQDPGSKGQSVQLFTRELDMSAARSIPLVFSGADWANPQDPRWNAPGKPSRTANITARTIIPQRNVNAPLADDAYMQFLVGLTLDRQKPAGEWMSAAYSTTSGEAAEQAFSEAMSSTFQWPDATSMKLQRIFSSAPYDARMREYAKEAVENYRSAFSQRSSKLAEAGLLRIEQAYSSNTDLFGLSATSVPMTTVAHRIQLFNEKLGQLYGPDGDAGLMKLWDDLKLSAASATAVDVNRVRELQADSTKKQNEADAIAADMTAKEARLSNIESAISSIDVQMLNRETFLKQQFEAEQDERRQRGETLKIAQATATVGSIVFPAAAPVLAGASGVIAAQQALQEPDADISSIVTSVQDIAQRHLAIVELSAQVRKDWNVVKADYAQAIDYVRKRGRLTEENKKRFDGWKGAVQAVRSNSEKLIKNLERPNNTEKLEFSHEEAAKDGQILRLLGERNDQVKLQQSLQSELATMRKDHDSRTAEILETEAVIAELLVLQISNDEERIRYMALSDWARRNLIRDLAKEASLLRRSLSYALGTELDLPLDVTLMAEGDLVESYGDLSDPAKLEASLSKARKNRAAIYGLLLSRAQSAYDRLHDENRWNVPTPILFAADSTSTTGEPSFVAARKKFIEELNGEIAGAIARVDSRARIRIPFYPDLIGTTERAVLLGVNVASIRFKGRQAPEGNLIFTIDHPRFGAIFRGRGCVVVADKANATDEGVNLEPVSWPTSVPDDVTDDWRKNINFANQLFRIQDAMFPLFAPYSMTVEVPQPQEWSTTPEVEAIEIQFIVARPN